MKKRALSLLLVFAMLLSACPIALAAEDAETRETNFFTQQDHADVDYSDMEYKHIETEPILEEMEAIKALLPDAANAKEVEERFLAIMDQMMEMLTMYALISIQESQNVMDEAAVREEEYTNQAYTDVADAVNILMRAILESPCADFLRALLTEGDIAYYLAYEPMTEEEKALSAKETSLESEYYQAAASITVEYGGEEWTEDGAYYAYYMGEISYEDYTAISTAFAKKQNEILGEIYLRMVELRKEIAAANGYDNYVDYAYEVIYGRDYTQEEIRPFHQAVKDGGFYELFNDLSDLFYNGVDIDVYYSDYTGEDSLDLVESYIKRMSSEMAEAFAYMRRHGLYDLTAGDYKDGTGYTTTLYTYGAPFIFNTPYGMIYDFTTIVHEFGHYNNAYWSGTGWNDPSSSYDMYEVHSQGLELMFGHWYDEIFEDSAQFVLDFQMGNLVSAIVDGCLHDELQQYVYAEEDLTLEKINRKYQQLSGEYGFPEPEPYNWVVIPHTFASPCYYISYATSAAGAFAFWLDAQEKEYFDVVDEYLKFTALPADTPFQESFAQMGMDNPISPEYISELAQTLRKAMNVDERLARVAPADLTGYEWFYAPLVMLVQAGIAETDEDHCIHPYSFATWQEALDLVKTLTKAATTLEQEKSGEPITRGDFARMLAGALDLSSDAESPFSDTDDAFVTALAELGVFTGHDDGTFMPDLPITRAEMYVAAYRLVMSVFSQLMGGAAA